ncbi:MAG: hypothetical protein GQ532_10915 [Methylomarinum sp.]|nr:hypothetical protein [Methylomarinum sp.]
MQKKPVDDHKLSLVPSCDSKDGCRTNRKWVSPIPLPVALSLSSDDKVTQ